jgi:hypothetical protein
VQELEAARFAIEEGGSLVKGFKERRNDCALEDGLAEVESLGPSRTIVLLVKQVHLQNVGTAASASVSKCAIVHSYS